MAGFDVGTGHRLTVHATVGWRHVFGGVRLKTTHALAGGLDFTVTGMPLARDAVVIDVSLTQQVTFGVRYNGQLGSDAQDHDIRADLTVKF